MKRLGVVVLILLLLPRCTDAPARVTVERQGFSVRGRDGIGVAALLQVDRGETVERIPIEVRLYDGDREVFVEHGELPFCVTAAGCWWAESYTSPEARGADRLVVTAGAGDPTDTQHRITELRDGGAPDDGLVAFVITGRADDQPRWGRSVYVRRGDSIAPPDALDGEERVRAFLYVGAAQDASRS